MQPSDVRRTVVHRLEEDLVGPHKEDESFEGERLKPSDVYLTGILWPFGDRMGSAEDDGSNGDDEGDEGQSTTTPVGQQRPCTMGVSFCVVDEGAVWTIGVTVRFATYTHQLLGEREGVKKHRWTRTPHSIAIERLELPEVQQTYPIKVEGVSAKVELHVRTRQSPIGRLVTVTVINRSIAPKGEREIAESLTLFQAEVEVRPFGTTRIVPRPERPSANDEDEKIGRLLYRNTPEFATGHQCSASWDADARFASAVRSEWLPQVPVIAFREDGHDVFAELVSQGLFEANVLAALEDEELLNRLERLQAAYGEWILAKAEEAKLLPEVLKPIAASNIEKCTGVRNRMRSGIDALRQDRLLLECFRVANAAMAMQHAWKSSPDPKPLCWRPFQLGFILLAAESVCRPEATDREVLDLLWFPTGGGKTEAYLALVAMVAFYRRMTARSPDGGAGNAAVMRYTLRLLTAQQFERATSLILACELIRRGRIASDKSGIAHIPFSIGLWVGGDATPNSYAEALISRGSSDGTSAEQIDECPCCHGKVRWNYSNDSESVRPYCENEDCLLGPAFGLWPVFTVDDDIYRERPTLVIGTIDKFALLTTKQEVSHLFSFGTPRATDLIIQDELHLISGPLGTIAGVYETAFDWLLKKDGCRPKVIGSTATIRRAADQVRALFDRESCQFPPPGLDHEDSGFAVRDPKKEPRVYVGVTTAGRSAKFALQAAAGSLLQSAGDIPGVPDDARDAYSTLLAYFNSLRELGGAIVQMLDDVPDSMKLYATQRQEQPRRNAPPRELTSRMSQKDIVEILSELKIKANQPGAVDVVLATNMVSVGVDISRLGLMLLNGQPKTRSEYIQATSRVGRSKSPGLVVSVLNAAKPRDRSHYETFHSWHSTLYRDVEATSVTPFASRARDRALHAALVAMVRHSNAAMEKRPDLSQAPDKLLNDVVAELERRVTAIDKRELDACSQEIDDRLDDWEARSPTYYNNRRSPNRSLLISADLNAQRRATGRLPTAAWPTMNNMRSVEASTRFRMAEVLKSNLPSDDGSLPADGNERPAPRWRRTNG